MKYMLNRNIEITKYIQESLCVASMICCVEGIIKHANSDQRGAVVLVIGIALLILSVEVFSVYAIKNNLGEAIKTKTSLDGVNPQPSGANENSSGLYNKIKLGNSLARYLCIVMLIVSIGYKLYVDVLIALLH